MGKFYLVINNGKFIGDSGEGLGTVYNMDNACKQCGTGYRLVGNLQVKGVNTNNLFFDTIARDFIISESLYQALMASFIKVGNLLRVIDYKTNHELPFYYFKPEASFPKMLPESEGITTEGQCPLCKQNGFFDQGITIKNPAGEPEGIKWIPRKYKYSISDKNFLEQSDIFNTWEHFGYSNVVASGNRVVRYARPLLIVSENVKRVFESQVVKNSLFEEIFIED